MAEHQAASPLVLIAQVPSSASLVRSHRMRSSSSRHIASGQNDAPSACMPVRVRRRLYSRAADGDRRQAGRPVQLRGHVRVADGGVARLPGQRGELTPGAARQAPGPGGGGQRPLAHGIVETARRRDLVNQAPGLRGLAAHPFAAGGDHIGEVLADAALVHQPGQPAGARQHRQQWHLGHGDRGGAVVDQDDLLAGEGELVAAAGGGAVHRREVGLAGVLRRVLDRGPRLVGELAEVHLPPVLGLGQHPDVGARAEHPVQPARDDHGAYLRVLEPQPLHRVGQLDVDPEIVGVELELVTGRAGRRSRPRPARSGRSRRRPPAAGGGNGSGRCRTTPPGRRAWHAAFGAGIGAAFLHSQHLCGVASSICSIWCATGRARGRRPARSRPGRRPAGRHRDRAPRWRGRCARCRAHRASRSRR